MEMILRLKPSSVFGVTGIEPSYEVYNASDLGVGTEKVYKKGGIDYEKLVERFGCKEIDETLLARIQKIACSRGVQVHPFLKRQLFFSHRDLELILNDYEQGKPFYIYTGLGPSSQTMHIGHLVPFMFTKHLQDLFDVPVVIQMSDDEKFLHKDFTMDEIQEFLFSNVADIIACGFNKEKTFIFSNIEYIGELYPTVLKIQKMTTNNQVSALFGFSGSHNIGQTAFPAVQAAPCFFTSFRNIVFKKDTLPRRCLIPCGIDQDPYFRMARDVAPRIGMPKPALIHSKFLPSLLGIDAKMSSSVPESAIFLLDTEKDIESKITKSFSGGKQTLKEHRKYGADLTVDIAYIYLKFFLEDNEEFRTITSEYAAGRMTTTQVKKRAIQVISPIIAAHQQLKQSITHSQLREFMTPRELDL